MLKIQKLDKNSCKNLLNDLMKFNEAFGKNATFDNIRNHKIGEIRYFSKNMFLKKP